MDLKDNFAMDKEKEVNGIWHEIGKAKLLIARMNNSNFTKTFEKLSAPYKKMMVRGSLDSETQENILTKAMSETILLGWEGVTDGGEPLTYSPKEAYRIMKKYPDFRNTVTEFSTTMTSYKEEFDEKTEGN